MQNTTCCKRTEAPLDALKMMKNKFTERLPIVLCIFVLSCNESNKEENFDIYGEYLCSFSNADPLLLSEGSIIIFNTNDLDSVCLRNFTDEMDTISISQYLSNRTVICEIENDTIEFVSAVLPNFGSFVIKGLFKNNQLTGTWILWGHLGMESFGSLSAIKTE